VPSNDSLTLTAPTITGRYTGPEGQYKVRVASEAGNVGNFELRIFGIENPPVIRISDTTATPLGTHGLFISFSETLANYRDTTWLIDIPNIDSSSYTTNLNAYEQAVRARQVAIEQAKADVRTGGSGELSIVEAQLARARADVQRIQAELARRRLTAPFSGIVTQVNVDPGEIVSANTVVASLISDDGFGIEIDLPEVDSIKVRTGNPATVTLDAFGDDVVFDALVTSVNRTETIVDNVSIYESQLAFVEIDERISSGMTADVTIVTQEREDVLAIPFRALKFREDGTPYVMTDGNVSEKEVVLGLRGSDSFVEILSGLSEGDTVIVSQ